MSGVVVLIGYLILIPSIFGVLFGMLGLGATGAATSEVAGDSRESARIEMEAAGVPTEIQESVLDFNELSSAHRAQLNQHQRSVVEDVSLSLSAEMVGVGVGATLIGGASAFVLFSSFIGGLLGWLLVMKKKVLQCMNCQAVVAAS